MRKYILLDTVTGGELTADAGMVERATGVETGYIDRVLEQDGKLENGDWAGLSRPEK